MVNETFTFEDVMKNLSRDNIAGLIKNEKGTLFTLSDNIRQKYCGESVYIRGIIEFSNYCCRNCLYCGLRAGNKRIVRYRMSVDEIVETAFGAVEKGIKTIVLQSGDDFWYTSGMIADIITRIKKNGDVAVTLSLGERPLDDYQIWREAGADRYLLKHETANPDLYQKFHPGQTLDRRIAILEWLKDLGYQIGAGNIVGLPGQTLKDLAEDILLMKRLDVDMAGIGPFIPHLDTPLGDCQPGSLEDTLSVIAALRIVLKDTLLPATTAVGTIHPYGREKALKAGANVVMVNLTPVKYKQLYQIYPDKICINEDIVVCLPCILERIESVGRFVSLARGDSLKWKRLQKVYACI